MDRVIDFLKVYGLKAVIGFVVLFLIRLLMKYFRKRKTKKEEERHAVRVVREKALDQAIINPRTDISEIKNKGNYTQRPYEVSYNTGDSIQQSENNNKEFVGFDKKQMLQLTEQSDFVNRKYMYPRTQGVIIGSQFGKITILSSLKGDGEVPYCELFYYKGSNYVRSSGLVEIILQRHRKKYIIDQKGMEIHDEDTILINSTRYIISLV